MTPADLSPNAEGLAELRAALFNLRETRPTHHIYLLLDRARPVAKTHLLHCDQVALRPVGRPIARLVDSRIGVEWQPVLLQLYVAGENGYPDEGLVELSLTTARERHASVNGAYLAAWVASELEPATLAAHLAGRCEPFEPCSGRRQRMSLYEPHRMALLADHPAAATFLDWFLARTPLWAFIDGAGALRTLVASNRDPEPSAPGSHLSLDMAASQRRVPLARLVLLGLVKAGGFIPAHVERKLDDLLIAADREGLSEAEDVVFFALNGLSLSPKWHLHPVARQCIARAVSDKAPLAGLMAALSDTTLDEIGAFST